MFKSITIMSLVFAVQVFSIGIQRANFCSQTTQGFKWIGTAKIIREKFDITVFSDYLDVEVEWVIEVSGATRPAEDNSLEILGDIELVENSTVVGMILWNGGDILEANLKTSNAARQEYEDVVERNVIDPPPRPRDPVLFEMIGEDKYRMSVFPVDFNGTRKLRFRYLIPSVVVNGVNKINYPHAFSQNPEITVRVGDELDGYWIEFTNQRLQKIDLASFNLDIDVYNVQYFNGAGDRIGWIVPKLKRDLGGSYLYIGDFEMQGFEGQMIRLIGMAPKGMLVSFALKYEKDFQLYATLTNNTDSVKTEVKFDMENPSDTYYSLTAYSKEPIRNGIIWSIYSGDFLMEQFVEFPTLVELENGLNYARVIGSGPFHVLAGSAPTSLASTLGFIDISYALLALEDDVMNFTEASRYENEGVPTLDPEDIFPSDEESLAIPVNPWFEGDLVIGVGVIPLAEQGINIHITDGVLTINIEDWRLEKNDPITIVIYDIRGNVVAEWVINWLNNPNQITWNPKNEGLVTGMYLLRIISTDVNVTKSILVK